MPTVTGELHRFQARFSPVNFTEYPRFLTPANTRQTLLDSRSEARQDWICTVSEDHRSVVAAAK